MTEEELTKNIQNRKWRLNNLYWIKTKKGHRIKFKLNWMQQHLLDNLHTLNIILKARQLGTTTFFCIVYLDDCIFNGYDCGLIAHTLEDAKKIFDTKVKYTWDNLPEALRNQFQVNRDSVRELKFRRGDQVSSMYVGTSLRSQTVQRLHISELPYLDFKYPEKAQEIKAGALNTVHKGNIVTIEGTAHGQQGVFYDMCMIAMDLAKAKTKLTQMDYKFFFFPWWGEKQYSLEGDIVIPKENKAYFERLERDGIILTIPQKNWYYKKVLEQKDKMKPEFPSSPEEAFWLNLEGSYFGKQMDKVLEQNRITKVPHDPLLQVDTWWDIGTNKKKSDAMAIVFTQTHGIEIRIIDYFGHSREGLPYFARMLDKKGYKYRNHYAPHDIEVFEMGSSMTRFDAAAKLGLHFVTLEAMDFLDSVEAVKNVLARCWFDEERTQKLIKSLKAFRREWDDKLGKWKDSPLKDWSSDPVDAFRLMCVSQNIDPLGEYHEEQAALDRQIEGGGEGFDPTNPFSQL